MTVFFAAIGTASDVVTGDYCDLTVTEAIVCGYKAGEDGEEIEELGFGGATVLDSTDLPIRTDDDDKLADIQQAAEALLEEKGFRVVGSWELADNAAYAQVEQTNEDGSGTEGQDEDEAAGTETVIWSVVEGDSRDSQAVEPGPIGVTASDEVLAWAERHGLADDNDRVYLLVTTKDEAGTVAGEIAYMEAEAPAAEAAAIREALADL